MNDEIQGGQMKETPECVCMCVWERMLALVWARVCVFKGEALGDGEQDSHTSYKYRGG